MKPIIEGRLFSHEGQDYLETTPPELTLNPDFILATRIVPAFTKAQAIEIGKRDKWRCQTVGCKKRFQDGWLVEMAHSMGKHGDNSDIRNGRTMCALHHLDEHLFDVYSGDGNFGILRVMCKRIYSSGLHTQRYYQTHPTQIIEDRDDIIELIRQYGFNPDDLLT